MSMRDNCSNISAPMRALAIWSRPKGHKKSAISGILQMAAHMNNSQKGSSKFFVERGLDYTSSHYSVELQNLYQYCMKHSSSYPGCKLYSNRGTPGFQNRIHWGRVCETLWFPHVGFEPSNFPAIINI